MNILYPAKFEETFEEYYECGFTQRQSTGFVITFRDVPEAITQANNFKDSLYMAKDALRRAMEFYIDREEEYPEPSLPLTGEVMIDGGVKVANSVNDWISVDDELPEMHKRVLIKADCYLVAGREPKTEHNKDWGIIGDWTWSVVNDTWCDGHMVTHWMPIPKFKK